MVWRESNKSVLYILTSFTAGFLLAAVTIQILFQAPSPALPPQAPAAVVAAPPAQTTLTESDTETFRSFIIAQVKERPNSYFDVTYNLAGASYGQYIDGIPSRIGGDYICLNEDHDTKCIPFADIVTFSIPH